MKPTARLRAITAAPAIRADIWAPDAAYMGASRHSRELAGWNPAPGSPDSDLLPDLATLRTRNRDLDRNNGIATGIHQTLVDNVVGTGLRLVSTPDYRALKKDKQWAEEWSTATESKWRSHAETTDIDAAGMANFYQLTSQIFRAAMLNGEGLALPLWISGRGYSTKFQVIEADRLATPWGMIDGPHMRGGIEIDDFGRPTAYNIRKVHPGDLYLNWIGNVWQFERIPAETAWGRKRVIHVHDQERSGQHRGKPLLAPVLTQFKMLDHYQRTEMQAAVVNAIVAAFIETPMDSAGVAELFGGDVNDQRFKDYLAAKNEYRVPLKGGAVLPLFPGDKLSSFAPNRPNSAFEQFTEAVGRNIGLAAGLPFELAFKNFSKSNYSNTRAALSEAWRFFIGRREWLASLWATPVYELWLEEAINAGEIEAPDFYENRYAYCRCRWNGPGRGWIDPVKEATAAQMRMTSLVSTLEKECAEQGLDWEEVLEQRAAEQTKMAELGIPDPAVLSSRQPQQVQDVEDEEDTGKKPAKKEAA